MKKILLLLCLIFFVGCAQKKDVSEMPFAIQNEKKIKKFHAKIAKAQKSITDAEKSLLRLKSSLFREELTCIKMNLASYKQGLEDLMKDPLSYRTFLSKDLSGVLLKERAELMKIMQSSPEMEKEAHTVLEEILRLITSLNEQKQKVVR